MPGGSLPAESMPAESMPGSSIAGDSTIGGSLHIGEPDVAFGGPQGNVPQFVADCPYSHTNSDDPIVSPGEPGAAHRHVFFGAVKVDAFTTADQLLVTDTYCDQQLDHSSYWTPALLDHGEMVVPDKVTAYYRPGPRVDPTTVVAYPLGLKMIAGAVHHGGRPSTNIASWTCGVGSGNAADPPDCPPDRGLRMIVTFPDCWDGVGVDSPEHRSHVVYSHGGACPSGHPTPIPQLTVTIAYLITGSGHDLSLSSGSVDTLHADFFNAWDVDKLRTEVESCLHRAVVCGVTSSKT